jgi:hypothetical protein
VILVLLKHAYRTVQHAWCPELRVGRVEVILRERWVKAMRLEVRLIDDIQPESRAELVEALCVGVVRHSDGIEVGLLHQEKVGQHGLLTDHLRMTASTSILFSISFFIKFFLKKVN